MKPPAAPGEDFGPAVEDFKRGGWIVSLFGGSGMLARMLLTDKGSPLIVWIRKITAAVIVGVLTYFALHGQDSIPPIYKAVLLAVSGMAAPELMTYILAKITTATPDNAKTNQSKAPRKGAAKAKSKHRK
jgi:hypothetical protein